MILAQRKFMSMWSSDTWIWNHYSKAYIFKMVLSLTTANLELTSIY